MEAVEQQYHCVICGPCETHILNDGRVIIHKEVEHPAEMTFDEEDNPQ